MCSCVLLLQASRVRFLASPLQTFSQYLWRGSRTVVTLAHCDQTARPEMASGLSGSSALLSLMRVVVYHVSIVLWHPRGLKGETRDVLSLRIRGAKLAFHLGVGLPRSARLDGLGCVQLLRALRVRLLVSSLQTVSQSLSRGSRMSCFCKDVLALAQSDQTARPEMASGLSQYSALLSLLQVTVVQVACCLSWFSWVTVWTRYCPLFSLAVDVGRVAQFGVGLPTLSIPFSLAKVTLCQCILSGLSVSSFYLLGFDLSARTSSCEVLESLVHCAQTTRNALVPASIHYPPLSLSIPRCVPQVVLDLPSYRVPCLRIRAAKGILHLDARLPTVIDLRGF